MKKIRAILLTICMLVVGMLMEVSVQAAAAPTICSEYTLHYEPSPKAMNSVGFCIMNCPAKAVVKNLKSSDKTIATVSWSKKQRDMIGISYKKVGKVNISFDLVWGAKKKHFKSVVTIKKYVCPVSSFKLAGKEFASTFKGKTQTYVKLNGKYKYKVSVKPKTGWVLDNIEFYNGTTMKTIANNTTVRCGKEWNYVNAHFHNPKTGNYISTIIYLQK